MEDQWVQSPQNFKSGEEGFFPQLPQKHEDQGALVAFEKVSTTVTDLNSFSVLGNKSGNVHYYFEVKFNFWNDW